ncbi:MAG: hemerythrin domain-containing protein [Kofleriaceae bacterium]
MKASSPNVLDLLISQHRDVDRLIARLESGHGDRNAIFAELADKLVAHAAAEEMIFYPAVVAHRRSQLLEAVEEHLEIKRVVADMLALDPDSEIFKAKLAVLKEDLQHHAHEEEEQELFPKLRNEFSEDTLLALGNDVLVMFNCLVGNHSRNRVKKETARAARLSS